MIQRIQSLWLFLASMLNGLLFLFPLYSYKTAGISDPRFEGVRQHIPLFIVAAVATLLPMITIFFFMARKKQMRLVVISILASVLIIGLMMMNVSSLKTGTPPATEVDYAIPGFLGTVLAILFEILAFIGIRKDDKLIKSLDRLR